MRGLQTRRFDLARPAEMRDAGDGASTFFGHAAVFDQRTLIGSRKWGFVEEIAPGTFSRAITEGDDVRALHNHDANWLLGRTSSGTLRLAEDAVGLASEIDFPDTQQARDIETLVRRRDITQMSFSFIPSAEERYELPESDAQFPGMTLYRVTDVDPLYDVSTVTYAAYPQTDAAMRGYNETMDRLVRGRKLSAAQLRSLVLALTVWVDEDETDESGAGDDGNFGSGDVVLANSADVDAVLDGEPRSLRAGRGNLSENPDAPAVIHGANARRWAEAFEAMNGKVSA